VRPVGGVNTLAVLHSVLSVHSARANVLFDCQLVGRVYGQLRSTCSRSSKGSRAWSTLQVAGFFKGAGGCSVGRVCKLQGGVHLLALLVPVAVQFLRIKCTYVGFAAGCESSPVKLFSQQASHGQRDRAQVDQLVCFASRRLISTHLPSFLCSRLLQAVVLTTLTWQL
jgi:hypothetical protein